MMSESNRVIHFEADRLAMKLQRQEAARRRIPFLGVFIRATEVRRHRYLRDRGLPHSGNIASVHLGIGK